ncbi:hypothetical protein [Noviherbaspirillum sp. ST9]|uniref:hypothetical protein n=1 Tax=Noviherbaspirillum sp. ST9 TaxID=3401606 RepID=UPI003B586C1B
MKPWLVLLNDFCHDLFTGTWIGSFIALVFLRTRAGDAVLLADLSQLFTRVCIGSVVALALCGMSRRILRNRLGNAALAGMQYRLVQLRHALLGTSMLGGTGLVIAWAV